MKAWKKSTSNMIEAKKSYKGRPQLQDKRQMQKRESEAFK